MSSSVDADAFRVAVQFGGSRTDFVLPADVSVTAVIPAVVDRLAPRSGWQEMPTDWQLAYPDGRLVSGRKSLRDNAVRDGDLLCLGRVRPRGTEPPADDPIALLSSTLDGCSRWTHTATRVAVSTAAMCCAAFVAYALLRSASPAAAMIAVALAAVAVCAAVAVGRVYRDMQTAVMLGASAVMLAAAGAYLMVPGDARAPKLMLAAAVAATVSLLAGRGIGSGTAVFTALSSVSALSAAAASMYVVAPVGNAATGALLASAAVALLVMSPRLAIWVAGVPTPSLRESPVVAEYADHARRAHAIATGLVCGSCAAAAFGAVLVTRGGGYVGAALAAALGIALMARTSVHVDLIQAAALLVSGALCFAAAALWAVGMWTRHAHWIAVAVAGSAALPAMWSSKRASPVSRRCVELVDYAALASLIPLTAWVCGAFTAIRGLHLS